VDDYRHQSEAFLTATLSGITGRRITGGGPDWDNDPTYSAYFEALSGLLRGPTLSGTERPRDTDDAPKTWQQLFSSPNILGYCKAIARSIDQCTVSRLPATRGRLLLSLDNVKPCRDGSDRGRLEKKVTEIADRFENAEGIYLFDPLGQLSADTVAGFGAPSRFVLRGHFLELLSVLSQFPNMVITGHPLGLLVSTLGHCKRTFYPVYFLAEFTDHQHQFCSSETTIF